MTQQPHPATYAPPRPSSALAVAGFVCSLLWGFGLLSLVGLAMSLVALKETRTGAVSGNGLAVAGVVLGVLGTIWLAVFIGTGIATITS